MGKMKNTNKFVKFASPAFLNGKNVAIYRRADGTLFAQAETSGGKRLGARDISSVDAISEFAGSGVGRLANMIEWVTREQISFSL